MKTTNLRLLALSAVLILVSLPVFSQTVAISTIAQPSTLVSCGSGGTITLNVNNQTSATVDSVRLTVYMTSGMHYVPGSVGPVPVSERDISVAAQPKFNLPELSAGQNMNLSFDVEAGCVSGVANADFTIEYLQGGSWYSNTVAMPSGIAIERTTLNIINSSIPATKIGHLNETFTVDVMIEAGGTGHLESFELHQHFGQNLYISSAEGSVARTDSNTTVTLGASDFTAIGDGDTHFEPGEQIIVHLTITVEGSGDLAGADIPLSFTARSNCFASVCHSDNQVLTIYFNTPDNYSFSYNDYYDDTLALCNDDSLSAYLLNTTTPIANDTLAATMYNVDLVVGFRHFYSPTSGVYTLSNFTHFNWYNFRVAGELIPVTGCAIDSAQNCHINLNNLFNYDFDGPGGLDDVDGDGYYDDLPFNERIDYSVRFGTAACLGFGVAPLDYKQDIGISRGFYIEPHFMTQSLLETIAAATRYRVWNYDNRFVEANTDLFPTDVYAGTPETFQFSFTRINRQTSSAGNYNLCTDKYIRWRIILPDGISVAGAPTTTDPLHYPLSGWYQIGDTVYIEGNVDYLGNVTPSLNIPLVADCGASPGATTIDWIVDYQCDLTCPCLETWVMHTSTFFYVHTNSCAGLSCINGIQTQGMSLTRTTYGWADTAQTVPLNETSAGVITDIGIACDMVRLNSPALVCDTLDNVYINTSYVNPYPEPYNEVEQFEFVSARVNIYDASTGTYLNVPGILPITDFVVDTFRYNFKLTTDGGVPGIPAGFVYEPGDSVNLEVFFRISEDLPVNLIEITNHFRTFHYSETDTGIIWGDNFGQAFTAFNPKTRLQIGKYADYRESICDTSSVYIETNHAFDDLLSFFPNEYRTTGMPLKWIVQMPSGSNYIPGSVRISVAGHGDFPGAPEPVVTGDSLIFTYPFGVDSLLPDMRVDHGKWRIEVDYTRNCMSTVDKGLIAVNYVKNHYSGACRDTLTTVNSDYFRHPNSDPILTYISGNQTVETLTDTTLADLAFTNYYLSGSSFKDATYTYLYASSISGSVVITDAIDITTGIHYPVVNVGSGAYVIQLDTTFQYQLRNIRLKFTTDNCANDLLEVHLGWNCRAYPDNALALGCMPQQDKINIHITNPEALMTADFSYQSSTSADLCEDITYEITITNTREASIYNITSWFEVPFGSGIDLVSGTAEMYHASLGGWVAIPDPVMIAGQYHIDSATINSLLPQGLAGVGNPLGSAYQELQFRFNVRTNCDYASGNTLQVDAFGYKACGGPVNRADGGESDPLYINGLGDGYNASISFEQLSSLSSCGSVSYRVVMQNLGNINPTVITDTTTPNDFVFLTVPSGLVNYEALSFNGIHNAPTSGEPMLTTASGQTRYQWPLPMGIAEGDSIVFEISLTLSSDTACGTNVPIKLQSVTLQQAVCVLTGDTCEIISETGVSNFELTNEKPIIDFQAISASLTPAPAGMETLELNFELGNSGIALDSSQTIVVDVYSDDDTTAGPSAGDALLASLAYNINLATGETTLISDAITIPAGTCNIYGLIDSNTNCICFSDWDAFSNLPLHNTAANDSLCESSSTQLGVAYWAPSYTYSWSSIDDPSLDYLSNDSIANPTFIFDDNSAIGDQVLTYILHTNRGNCSSEDTVVVTVVALPTANAGPDDTICTGSLVDLYGTGGISRNWMEIGGTVSSTGSSFAVVPSSPGLYQYQLMVFNSFGCVDRDTVSIQANYVPESFISVTDTALCGNDTTTVNFTGVDSTGTNYYWDFDGAAAYSPTGNAPFSLQWATSGAKEVSLVTEYNGCYSDTSRQTVNVFDIPVAAFIPSPTSVCEDELMELTFTGSAGSSATYNWNYDGAAVSSSGHNMISWANQGHYTVKLFIEENGCVSDTASETIEVRFRPNANFTLSDMEACTFDGTIATYTGDASAVATFNWMFGSATASPGTGAGPHLITAPTAGTYPISLVVTENGCPSDTQTLNVDFTETPTPDFTISEVQGCTGNEYLVTYTGTADSSASFDWHFDGAVVSPGTGIGPHTVSWNSSGIKEIRLIVTANGCASNMLSQTIEIGQSPAAEIEILPNGPCAGDGYTADFTGTADAGSSYNWNFDGATLFSGSGSGPYDLDWALSNNYTVVMTVTASNGCLDTDSANVFRPEEISVDLIPEHTSCVDGNDGSLWAEVEGGMGNYSFLWNNGVTDSMMANMQPGKYTLTVTDNAGCTAGDSIIMNNPPALDYDIVTDSVSCFGGNDGYVAIDVNNGFGPFDFSFNEGPYSRDNVKDDLPSGLHYISIKDEAGCEYTAAYVIHEPAPIEVELPESVEIDLGESVMLEPTVSADRPVTYSWNPVNTLDCATCLNPVAAPPVTTVYEVVVTDPARGCEANADIEVIVNDENPDVFIPNAFTPNGDYNNDVFYVYGSAVMEASVEIYDRWGEQIFASDDMSVGWDGTYNGKQLPVETYIYVVELTLVDNSKEIRKGSVALLR